MTLQVFTARISCRDPDRFDVTRKSGGPAGHVFAPSWGLLNKALTTRQSAMMWRADASGLRKSGRIDDAVGLEREADAALLESWERYEPAFLVEMRRSFLVNRGAWDALLARERVVLVCYCAKRDRCHRGLLAGEILPKLGAVDCGELKEEKKL